MPIDDYLRTCKTVSKSDARFTYVGDDFLKEQKIRGWIDLPPWTSPRETGMLPVSVAKAVAAGLSLRPVVETIGDTLEWYRKTQGARPIVGGLSRDAEAKALAAWHAKHG
jgi:2'-hydroxyisoflavone reductase